MNSQLQEVIANMLEIKKLTTKLVMPKITSSELEAGKEASRAGSRQQQEVAMTPLMKNALKHYGDVDKNGEVNRVYVDTPQTKAEKALARNIKQLLLVFNKDGRSGKFNENIDLYSKAHYDTQCWQNFHENMRFIQPGQEIERDKISREYSTPTKFSIDQMITKLKTDKIFSKAVELVMDQLPQVKASHEIREINLPFMTKHSGVGFKWWKNDRTIVPGSKMNYAELTMQEAESIKNDPPLSWVNRWNISTQYGRNQRKGRLIIAVSRVLNLLLNQLEAEEISIYKKKCPLFQGYLPPEDLKKTLIQMADYCKSKGLRMANEDFSRFDLHVSEGAIALVGAISVVKSNGARSKKIALARAAAMIRSWIIDKNGIRPIFGRIFSGFIDTNRAGGIWNAICMTYGMMLQDNKYSEIVYDALTYMLVMGDDNDHMYRTLDREKMTKDLNSQLGMDINTEKYEYGPVFLQYRVFHDPESEQLVMVYAWTRVVASMLMKESAKGLGPVGWTWAFYQQLEKLKEYKQAFSIAVNLLIPFDEQQFMIDIPIVEQIKMLKAEDEAALSKAKTESQRNRVSSTLDKLYDGDPSKEAWAQDLKKLVENPSDQNVKDSYLYKMQQAIKSVIDPNFYKTHGLI